MQNQPFVLNTPPTNIRISHLLGVGNVRMDLQECKHAYVFIGKNGIGKTKILEAVEQALLLSNRQFHRVSKKWQGVFPENFLLYQTMKIDKKPFSVSALSVSKLDWESVHDLPVVFIASQNRGYIAASDREHFIAEPWSVFDKRRHDYFVRTIHQMKCGFTSLNMNESIDDWFAVRAKSANPYQKQEDNREVEIKTVLQLLHLVDEQIDPNFIELDGDDKVSIKVGGTNKQLAQLSSGFASILKVIQAIVSGYGNFTNEINLQNVKGIVLIDEIESHLHVSWQVNMVPMLKRLFPNTTFYITTHSPLILSRLETGEAYRLQRHEDGVVYADLIQSPNKAALVDVLKDAFDVDVNQNKLNSVSPQQQQEIRQSLQDFLEATK